MARVKIPMVTPASTHVDFLDGPFRRLMAAARAAEQRGAAAASLFTVQPWLDVPDFGFAALVVTRADAPLAESLAAGLAEQVWSERHAFMETELVSPEEAIGRALARPDGPVVLSDLADGTGAGSPGDATAVLAALLEAEPNRPALVCVCDPAVAAEAARTGAGGRIDTLVGGKRDCVFNRPVRFAGTVDFSRPASYRFSGPAYTGIKMEMGLTAVLRRGNVRLLVTSNPVMTVDPALYRAGGLEPADAQIVVVKSHIQFRAGYAGLAKEIILLDSPGMSSDHLAALPFRRVRRPLFPLDCDFEWSARG